MAPHKSLILVQPDDRVRRVINSVAKSVGVNELSLDLKVTAIEYNAIARKLCCYTSDQYTHEINEGAAVRVLAIEMMDCILNPITEKQLGRVQLGDGDWVDVTLRSTPCDGIDILQVGCNTLQLTTDVFNVMRKIDAHYFDKQGFNT